MNSGVLHGLGNDGEEIVAYVLLTLCDRVLVPESLVLPGLRSVLFRSATLKPLIGILERWVVVLMQRWGRVCTDLLMD